MNWMDDARALDQRIQGLAQASMFLIHALAVNSSDAYKVSDQYLSPEASLIFEEVKAFRERHGRVLPPAAINTINRFVSLAEQIMTADDVKGLDGLKARIAPLAAFRSELLYLDRF